MPASRILLNGHYSKVLVKTLNLIPIRLIINGTTGTYMSNEKCDQLRLIWSRDDLDLTNFPENFLEISFHYSFYSLQLSRVTNKPIHISEYISPVSYSVFVFCVFSCISYSSLSAADYEGR